MVKHFIGKWRLDWCVMPARYSLRKSPSNGVGLPLPGLSLVRSWDFAMEAAHELHFAPELQVLDYQGAELPGIIDRKGGRTGRRGFIDCHFRRRVSAGVADGCLVSKREP